MRIIISPAKNMSQNNKELEYNSLPIFLEDTKKILSHSEKISLNFKIYGSVTINF